MEPSASCVTNSGLKKERDVGEGRGAPPKTVVRRTTVAAAAAILYTLLDGRRPQ